MPVQAVRYLSAVLHQKRSLLSALKSSTLAGHPQDGGDSQLSYTCSLAKASIGQHLRHSLDHVRKLIDAATVGPAIVYYDARSRGTDIEFSVAAADREVDGLVAALENCKQDLELKVNFMLGGESPTQQDLSLVTSLSREMAFVAHHSIHHNAMILMIIRNNPAMPELHRKLLESEPSFGFAPSTVDYKNRTKDDTMFQP